MELSDYERGVLLGALGGAIMHAQNMYGGLSEQEREEAIALVTEAQRLVDDEAEDTIAEFLKIGKKLMGQTPLQFNH